MYWRRFSIASIPIDDSKAFELWLRARWIEKDYLIENWFRTGSFPADKGVDIGPNGKTRRGAGHVETVIKAMHWYEFLQAFMPVSLLGLVLYAFYGALPQTVWKTIKGNNNQSLVERFNQLQDDLMRSAQQKLLEFANGGSSPNRRIGRNKPIAYRKPAIRGLITQGPQTKALTPHKTTPTNKLPVKHAKQTSIAQKKKPKQSATSKVPTNNQTSVQLAKKPKPTQPQKLVPKTTNSSIPKKLEPKVSGPGSSTSKKSAKLPQQKALPSKAPVKKLDGKKSARSPQENKV